MNKYIVAYFYDCEFIEGWKKPIKWLPTIGKFNKPYHSIQLISIGVVCEDGRAYYAVSNEFDPSDASDWVKENVLNPLEVEMAQKENYAKRYHPALLTLKNLLRWQGKSNHRIANEIVNFIHGHEGLGDWLGTTDEYFMELRKTEPKDKPELYGYYSDYDHVLLCSLFGTMMDLPKGFPMHTIDLKQEFDNKAHLRCNQDRSDKWLQKKLDNYQVAIREYKNVLRADQTYPTQENKHNALDDAKWNLNLYKFIETI